MWGDEPRLIPRPEHPRPSWTRDRWLNLNGWWEFEVDGADDGIERGLASPGHALSERILVPFCPESSLSGIGRTGFMEAVWYRRRITVPADWAGCRPVLRFQAVDHDATVWANGVEVGRHRGGFTPFECQLSRVTGSGRESEQEVEIVVRARDHRDQHQPRGKQSERDQNWGCYYTRTTGIWQTVWLEAVPPRSLARPLIEADLAAGMIRLQQRIDGGGAGLAVRATLTDAAGVVTDATVDASLDWSPRLDLAIPADRRRAWSPEDPHLYGLRIELLDAGGQLVDALDSYAGLRGISRDGRQLLLNGRRIFQRLVLDQGYWPDGNLTAPSDDELVADIERAQAAGFNGARLHQKVFEERFLYHADRLGYLCWGEYADWGLVPGDGEVTQLTAAHITQWLEAVERDRSHPCLVGWCGTNEVISVRGDRMDVVDDVIRGAFVGARLADGTRPVLDASGYAHRVRESDVYDSHDYDQQPETFAARHGAAAAIPYVNLSRPAGLDVSVPYGGQPYFVSEFGGIRWNPAAAEGEESWGYGRGPRTEEEFMERFAGLVGTLLDNPGMFGYCYTQLTDVHQEENGLYTFDRRPKFDMSHLAAIQGRRAAAEDPSAG